MIDPTLLIRANDVLDRLFLLDEAIANATAFRSLLEALHVRDDLSTVNQPHLDAIKIVRAGILRAAIGVIMAVLDPADRRGNRASLGQILDMLRHADVAAVLSETDSAHPGGSELMALQKIRDEYALLLRDDLFDRGHRLRNDAIAHLLVSDSPTPTVPYEDIYALDDSAERWVTELFKVCRRGSPRFVEQRAMLDDRARVFWKTYFKGMSDVDRSSQA